MTVRRTAGRAQRSRIQGSASGRAKEEGDLLEILTDAGFWLEQKTAMLLIVQPLFHEAFRLGVELGARQPAGKETFLTEDAFRLPARTYDVDAIARAADDYIRGYSDAWWDYLEKETKERLRDAIVKARELGLGPKEVAELIEPLFGKERALLIARTEMTNLIGGGAQAQYRAEGYTQWQWASAEDGRVCPVCDALAGTVFPMTTQFWGAHPACRCWALPYGDSIATFYDD